MKWLQLVPLCLGFATAVVDKNSAEYQQRYAAIGGSSRTRSGRAASGYGYGGGASQVARSDVYEIPCRTFDSQCPDLHRVQYMDLPPPGWRCQSRQDCASSLCNTRTGKCECQFLSAGPDCNNWRMIHKEWEFMQRRDGLPKDALPDAATMRQLMRGVPLPAILSTIINQWALVQDPTTSERDVWVRKKLGNELRFLMAAGTKALEGTDERLTLTNHLVECMNAVNTGVTWATKNLLRFNQMEQVLHEGIEEYGSEWFYELLPILLEYGEHPNVDLDINAVLPQQHGHTLLSLAGHGSFYGAMEIFLDHGANPTDQTLLRCARMGDVKCIEILLDAGADPLAAAAKDEWGRSPLEVARLNQFVHYTKSYDVLLDAVKDRLPADYEQNLADVFGKWGPPQARHPPGTSNNATAVSCSSNGLCEIADGSYDSVYIPRADMHLRKRCPIQVVDAAELSQEEFRRDFFMLGKPVIVRNATDNWPAFWMWSDEHLLEEHGDTMVTVGEIPYGDKFGRKYYDMTMRDYLSYIQEQEKNPSGEPPLYIFDSTSLDDPAWTNPNFKESDVREGIDTPPPTSDGGHIPPSFHHSKYTWMADGPLHDYYGAVMHDHGTRWHQWYIGPPETGAPFHFHCQAFNTLTHGRKLWMIFSPSHPNMGMTCVSHVTSRKLAILS
eukprot:INCI15445.2.p1 GENE.INCI15445.2~~INCI15445.2.p1  ORF type:complete len:668 (-),score=95.10 INCI15445.2:70-2073(-)